ncbi:MAG: 4'-phosphopantetheinyl transferase superfamily protein [Pseudomonadota bacterium]
MSRRPTPDGPIAPPSSGEVHLWLAQADPSRPGPHGAGRYAGWLSGDERERWLRFRFAHDRERYLLARGLLRSVLSRYVPERHESAWRFQLNDHGRPFIVDEQQPQGGAPLYFNLSHTRGLVVLAVACSQEVGVDVEPLERDGPHLKMADRFFAPSEADALRALGGAPAHRDRFIELWTLKESYIKARGMGLALPLDSFAFELDTPGRIDFQTWSAAGDEPMGWRFALLEHGATHRVALALRDQKAAPTELTVRHGKFPAGAPALPTASDRLSPTRCSPIRLSLLALA